MNTRDGAFYDEGCVWGNYGLGGKYVLAGFGFARGFEFGGFEFARGLICAGFEFALTLSAFGLRSAGAVLTGPGGSSPPDTERVVRGES